MEEQSYHYFVLFTGLFLCLLHSGGVSSSCDNINQIDFAEITYEPEGLAPHPDGTVASIECGVFYQIVPTAFERTTCTDGSWTGPLPGCRHVPRYCQRNEDLVQIYGRDCQTQCRNRLNGACPGNKQCHCDGVCGWSCISIYEDNFCPEVADQAGLLVTYDPPERPFNGFADFSCGDDYIYHSGSSRLLCMSNRQWGGGNEIVCIPNDNQNPVITCPADFTSDTLTVSFLVYVTDNIDPAPALTYDPLGPGSTFPMGPTTVTVTATDSSSNHDSCTFTVTVTVPCGHPVRASRSSIEILSGVYVQDTRVRYSCSEGWEIEGTAERECDNGQWTGSTPVCRVAAHLRCMLPDHRSSGARYSIRGFIGNVVEEGLPIGERVSISVSCNPGYRAQPAVQTACLKRGAWSVDVPICERVPQARAQAPHRILHEESSDCDDW